MESKDFVIRIRVYPSRRRRMLIGLLESAVVPALLAILALTVVLPSF